MRSRKRGAADYARWQTLFTAGLLVAGTIYTVAAIMQWHTMREQSRVLHEQSQIVLEQLRVMKAEADNAKAVRSADFVLRIAERFSQEPYASISIDIGAGKPLLKQNQGKFSEANLLDYLNIFEDLHSLYARGLIDDAFLDSAYSDQIRTAADHPEIQEILNEAPGYYSGFRTLAKKFRPKL